MKFIAKMLGFENETYNDPAGQSSAGRKALVGSLVALILLIFTCVVVAVFIDPKQAASVHTFYVSGLTALGAAITAAFAFVYGGKAHTQASEAKARAVEAKAKSPTTNTPTKPPQAPPLPDSVVAAAKGTTT